MRTKKQSEMEQFTISNNPCESSLANPDALLNDIYNRIKSKSNVKEASTSDSNIILLSYLSNSHANEHPTKDSTQPHTTNAHDALQKINSSQTRTHQQPHPFPIPHKPKKYSQNERLKTDFDDLDSVSEVEYLRRENECLKAKLAKSEKRVVVLQSFQCEAEYMRKLIYIQNSEIDKLRRMLKATKQEQLTLFDQENRSTLSATNALKEAAKSKKQPILISDQSQNAVIDYKVPKRKKCQHRHKEEQGRCESVEAGYHSKSRSFHCTSKQDVTKKSSLKGKKQRSAYR